MTKLIKKFSPIWEDVDEEVYVLVTSQVSQTSTIAVEFFAFHSIQQQIEEYVQGIIYSEIKEGLRLFNSKRVIDV